MRKYSSNRSGRIADKIHKDIVEILRQKVKDPRVVWVTISDVEVSDDYSIAKVYWTTLEDDKKKSIGKALEAATGFIRSELSHGFKTYTIPQLRFIYDDSLERGMKLLNIIHKVTTDDETE